MFVAMLCPSIDSKLHVKTHYSLRHTHASLTSKGISLIEIIVGGNSHLSATREKLLWDAWYYDLKNPEAGKPTHYFWFDADMAWEPGAVEKLIDSDFEFVGAPGLKKQETTEFCGEYFQGGMAVHKGCIEVIGLGFAFVLLKRSCIQKMIAVYKELGWFHPRSARMEWALFRDLCNDDGHWIAEDLSFCHRWRKMGGKVWAHLDVELGHCDSTKVYTGKLGDWLNLKERAA